MAQLKEFKSVEEWEKALSHSDTRPLLVIKHSTACPISAGALKEFEAHLKQDARSDIEYAIVKVIESRDVSNKIADDLGVKHESPQTILVKNKKEVWHSSHQAITESSIREALN